jgi:hypothetical protein
LVATRQIDIAIKFALNLADTMGQGLTMNAPILIPDDIRRSWLFYPLVPFAQSMYVDWGRCLHTAYFDPSKYISECPYHYGTEAGNGESCQNEALTG